MKWERTENLIPGEKYLLIHKNDFYSICSWHRTYHGRYKYTLHDMAFFDISYCFDYCTNERILIKEDSFLPCIAVYQMVRTGQASMERRSYEMILQQLIDGIIVPTFL